MADRKSLTVHYRRMDSPDKIFNGDSLEGQLRKAMTHTYDGGPLKKHWKRRAWSSTSENSDTYLMNIYYDDEVSFFGDLTLYSSGFMQALLRHESEDAILPVEQQPPPEGREYIHSMMFWMVIGNHVMTIQSQSLTTKHLEQYLTWFLKERANQITENEKIILIAKFDTNEVGGSLDDVKEIIVGGTGAVQAIPTRLQGDVPIQVRETDLRVDLDSQRSWGNRARDVLRAIMNNEADVNAILADIPEGADLDVSVHIGYKTRKRQITRAPMQQVLRNLPDGEITAIGRDGRMSRTDIRLSYPVRVLLKGNLLDPDDVRAKLRAAYDYFIDNGKIEI